MPGPKPGPATIPVFDVGNVLIEWDPRHLYRRLFTDSSEMETFLATVCTPEWNRMMDAGKTFAQGVAELTVRFPEHDALIRAYHERWQEMVPRAFEGTVAILRALKERRVPVYAITNFPAEKWALERRRWPFLNWFDGVVVSGEVGLIKPDPAIYQCLIDSYGLRAEQCLFIDDSPANVAAARAIGMSALWFETAERLRTDLEIIGLL